MDIKMKKMRLWISVAAVMMMVSVMPVSAGRSPEGTGITEKTQEKTATSPKTGEGNGVLYGAASALLLGGIGVISGKKLKESAKEQKKA